MPTDAQHDALKRLHANGGEPPATPTPIEDLRSIADELAEKWDAGMKAGKLLAALEGRITNYDPRITRVIAALKAASTPQSRAE